MNLGEPRAPSSVRAALGPLPFARPLRLKAFGPLPAWLRQRPSRLGPREDPSRPWSTRRLPYVDVANPEPTLRRTPPYQRRGTGTAGRQRGSSSEEPGPNTEPATNVATAPPLRAPTVKRTPPPKRRGAPTAGSASGSSSEEPSPSPRHPRMRENPCRTNAELHDSRLRCCHRWRSRHLPREVIFKKAPDALYKCTA